MRNRLLDVAMPTMTENPLSYFAYGDTAIVLFVIGAVALAAVITVFCVIGAKRKAKKNKTDERQTQDKGEDEK